MRNFKLLFILIVSMLMACSQNETSVVSNPCSTSINLQNLNQINPNKFEFALEMCRSVSNQNSYTNENQLFDYFFKQDQNLSTFKAGFVQESQLYKQLGFDNYVLNLFSLSKISDNLKTYLLSYKSSLLTFIETHPTIEQFTLYNNSKLASLPNSNLCDNELYFLKTLINSSQGYAQYYFKHHLINSSNRGCNFWEALACGYLAGVIGLNVGVPVGVLIAVVNLFPKGEDDYIHQIELSVIIAVAVTTYITVIVYKSCCPDDEIALCSAPTGAIIKRHACNDFTYTVVGPGNYLTTSWDNENTNPAVSITPTPSLRLSVPNLAAVSRMIANIRCVDPIGTSTFGWNKEATFGNPGDATPPPPLTWNQSPPASAQVSTTYNISVSPGSFGQYILSWSVSSSSGIVSSTGASSGNLQFFSSGQKTVTATLTNTCTGQSTTLSKTVNVQ